MAKKKKYVPPKKYTPDIYGKKEERIETKLVYNFDTHKYEYIEKD